MADARIRAVITADDRASAVIAGFGTKAHTGLSRFTKFALGGLGVVGVTAAFHKMTDFVLDSVDAFAKEEIAISRLKTGIKNVKSATDDNIDSLLRQAEALQTVTRFSDEQIISAQGFLSTFQLNQRAIENITPRLIDMSEGLARVDGVLPDLEGNAALVAKAIGGEDITGLVGALRRANVIMTDHQMHVLKTGTFQERLALITKVLDMNFKNLGTSAGKTTAGGIVQLQNALDDLKEIFGGVIANAINPFIRRLTEWARTDKAKDAVRRIAEAVVNFGRTAANFIKTEWPEIKSTLINLGTLAWWIARGIAAVGSAISRLPNIPDWMKSETVRGVLRVLQPALFLGQIKKRQHGGPVMANQPYLVGERGPELMVPRQSGDIRPNAGGGQMIVNISPQIGVFAGSAMERRKLAEQIYNDLKDVANSKGINLQTMIQRG